MDYKVILNLMKEMNHTDLTKVEIEEEGIRICIEKAAKGSADQMGIPQVTYSQAPMYLPQAYAPSQNFPAMQGQNPMQQLESATTNPSGTANNADAQSEDQNHRKIVSPMVGTFYSQASPDKPPFVKVGDKVKKGQTICIIEAMKLMNEIESEQDGEIVKILTNNEDMVEFGQPMFLIK